MGLDLSKAVDAAEGVLWNDGHNGYGCDPEKPIDYSAEDAVKAALPHILEAVAANLIADGQAYLDARLGEGAEDEARTYLQADRRYAAQLRALAEEARA